MPDEPEFRKIDEKKPKKEECVKITFRPGEHQHSKQAKYARLHNGLNQLSEENRSCLTCDKSFLSASKANRMCKNCKRQVRYSEES